jgi:hypothetical protein
MPSYGDNPPVLSATDRIEAARKVNERIHVMKDILEDGDDIGEDFTNFNNPINISNSDRNIKFGSDRRQGPSTTRRKLPSSTTVTIS